MVTAILFSGFVMYDMQRLKNAQQGVDDPIMLAVGIYLSIFNLFLAIRGSSGSSAAATTKAAAALTG